MRKTVLALILAASAAPAFAGMGSFDLPRLTFPADTTVTGSTKGCVMTTETTVETPACR